MSEFDKDQTTVLHNRPQPATREPPYTWVLALRTLYCLTSPQIRFSHPTNALRIIDPLFSVVPKSRGGAMRAISKLFFGTDTLLARSLESNKLNNRVFPVKKRAPLGFPTWYSTTFVTFSGEKGKKGSVDGRVMYNCCVGAMVLTVLFFERVFFVGSYKNVRFPPNYFMRKHDHAHL